MERKTIRQNTPKDREDFLLISFSCQKMKNPWQLSGCLRAWWQFYLQRRRKRERSCK